MLETFSPCSYLGLIEEKKQTKKTYLNPFLSECLCLQQILGFVQEVCLTDINESKGSDPEKEI